MRKKIKMFISIAVLTFFFIQITFFNPFTAKSAIRGSVLLHGFVVQSYILDVEIVPALEISKIGDLTLNDLTLEQTVYRIVSPSLRNDISGTEMQYWIVTKKNGLYHAEFSGY